MATMTDQEGAAKMREFEDRALNGDEANAHNEADDLLVMLLQDLGYTETAQAFAEASELFWYD